MSPAPANESATCMSPFFTTATAATPLSERDCNGAFACPPVSKAPTSAACAMRRGTSFLDADDACLALSDKNSFLIPEDSYLPGQENYAAAPCAPSALPALGRAQCPCPSTGAACSSFSNATITAARSRMPTPFLVLDTPVFGVLPGEEEFAAASVCFEKAVQALEMVERPGGLHGPSRLSRQSNPCTDQDASSLCGVDAAGASRQTSSTDYEQQTPDLQQPRRVSSLSPSPPASQLGSSGEQLFPPQLQHDPAAAAAVAVAAAAKASGRDPDYAESEPTVCWSPAMAAQEPGSAVTDAENAAAAAAAAPGNATMFMGFAEDGAGAWHLAGMDGAVPAAPAPIVKAFHHKTGGPCDHCGATESPQWRRGPPAKPMLCNACGTRFRRTNQLNPAAALSPASRAAAAAAAAAVAAGPAAKRNAAKRDPPYVASTSTKRGRSLAAY